MGEIKRLAKQHKGSERLRFTTSVQFTGINLYPRGFHSFLFNELVITLHYVVRSSLDNPGEVNQSHFTTKHTEYISLHMKG